MKKTAEYRKIMIIGIALAMTLFRIFLGVNMLLIVRSEWKHDDGLVMCQAINILDGNWLGTWNQLTLTKGCIYPVFLAFCGKTGLPYLLVLYLLYSVAAFLLVIAVKPLVKNGWACLAFYIFLLFSPAMMNYNTVQYIYRNALIPTTSILTVASFIGIFLRQKKVKSMIFWIISGGFSLSSFYYICENSIWLGIFAVGATVITGVYLWKETERRKELLRILLLLIPFIMLFMTRGFFSYINYRYYGAAILNSRMETNFKEMMLDMILVERDETETDNPVWITRSMMEDMVEESATLKSIEPFLDQAYKNWGCPTKQVAGDFTQWVMLDAMYMAGVYNSVAEGEIFCEKVSEELKEAFSEGRLQKTDRKQLRLSSMARGIGLQDIPELMRRLGVSLSAVITLDDAKSEYAYSSGNYEELIRMSEILGTKNIETRRVITGWAFAKDDTCQMTMKLLDDEQNELEEFAFQNSKDVYMSFPDYSNSRYASFSLDVTEFESDSFYLAIYLNGERNKTIEISDLNDENVMIHIDDKPQGAGLKAPAICKVVQDISNIIIRIYQMIFVWTALAGILGYVLISQKMVLRKDKEEKKNWFIVSGLFASFMALQIGNCWYMSFFTEDVYQWWVFNYASGSIVILQIAEGVCIIRLIDTLIRETQNFFGFRIPYNI